jgi:hypothetical protein
MPSDFGTDIVKIDNIPGAGIDITLDKPPGGGNVVTIGALDISNSPGVRLVLADADLQIVGSKDEPGPKESRQNKLPNYFPMRGWIS